MIPRKIHYCWFGPAPLPSLAKECIASWHQFMPDWEYCIWNEENFDIDSNFYTREAYAARKYAFVSDYVRLHALKNFGGVYLDTDVQVLRSLDPLICHDAFAGFLYGVGLYGFVEFFAVIVRKIENFSNFVFG